MQRDTSLDVESSLACEMRTWRTRALNNLLTIATVVALPLVLIVVIEAISSPKHLPAALAILTIYLLLVGLAVLRRINFHLRVRGALLLGYLLGVLTLARGGLAGDGRIYLLVLPPLAIILAGWRIGVAMAVLSVLTFAAFTVTAHLGWMAGWLVRQDNTLLLVDWAAGGLALIVTMMVLMILQWRFSELCKATAVESIRLYEESDRLRAFNESIVNGMQEGLLVEDATGDITFVNPKAAELLGHSPDNLIGQPWRTFVAPEHIAKVEEATIQQSRESISRYDAAVLTRGGRRVPVIVSTHPMFDGGHFSGVLSVFTDITEQKQTEEELQKHQHHLEELVKERAAELAQANEQLRQEITERKRTEEALRHRLLVLSQPAGEIGDLRLTDTVDTDVLQRLQDSLAESYGVASLMFDQDGEPITKPSNFSDFCNLIRATQKGMERCEASHASLSRLVADGSPGLAPCKNFQEIQDGAVPIYIGDRHVATWGIGQRVVGELPEEKVRSYAKEIGADADQLAAAARKLEAESKEQLEQAMSFLGTVATSISLLGLQNIQQAREITERKRAERESEGRRLYLESVLAHAPDAIVTLDAQHNILEWNAGAERLFGYTLEEVVGRNIDDLITASDADVFEEAAALTQQVLAGESVPSTETVRYRKDGSPVDVIVSGSPILIGDEVIGVVVVYIDITERKQAEEALQRRSSELALINQIGQALTSTLDLDEVLFTLLEEIKRLLGVTGSSVWLIDPDTEELVCRQASGPKGEIVRRWRLAPGEGVAGWAAHRGKSVIVPDIWADGRHYEYLDQVTGLDLRSILTIPLRVRDQVIGVLQVVDSEVDRFSAPDLMLLEPLAATAAIAIENARLYKQARQDAEAKSTLLREINHRTKNNLSLIIGLLYAARRHIGEKDRSAYRSILNDLTNRLQGLATVNDLLSASGWKPLLLSEVAAWVIRSSLQTLSSNMLVSVDVTPSPVRVTPDQAHNLALVINELTSNTAEHAIRERNAAHITVHIALDGDTIVLKFQDDGPGYPEEVLRLEHLNVGLDLIQNIVQKSLRGELSLHNDHGAVTTILFKADVEESEESNE